MIYLQIADSLSTGQTGSPAQIDNLLLEQTARQVLLFTQSDPAVDASIVLTDDAQLHALDLQFLGIDAPTDVLAFPSDETDPDSGAAYLGDVIISYPRAQGQAASGGYGVTAELQLLVVHGLLHLLGYDHARSEQKTAMWAAQAEILAQVGCPIRGPVDSE